MFKIILVTFNLVLSTSIVFANNISDIEKKLNQSNYKIVLFEDFSKKFKYKKIKKNIKKFEYLLPSEPNWKAFRDSMKIENEEMIMTIKPGTRQWDGDKKMELKERSGDFIL